ncbi:hypothetical protein SAMN04488073_1107 [Marinobacter gudaonensis]|uniref:Uncharacterized protein n=1 Tax=Marinobacter gudaonensis TaxID=375760 RepID=A0A1I6GLP2_9GAMM|nr:hypothetical protein [Marinobacter gudaonensis]SFR43135.1 hypothetical protein SAMN04488073_1107 [Marinobacter gudaonensis]
MNGLRPTSQRDNAEDVVLLAPGIKLMLASLLCLLGVSALTYVSYL